MLRPTTIELEAPRGRTDASHRTPELPCDPRLMAELTNAIDQHVGVACTDRAGLFTFANRAFSGLFGYAPAELLGRQPRILNSGHHSPAFFAELWSTILAGKTWSGELKNRRKDGGECWIAATIAPLGGGASLGSSYVTICSDITRLKSDALADAERQRSELSRQSEELRQYAYVASHDLQEPLRAIVGCGQLLRQEYAAQSFDATARQLLDHMIEGGLRMQQLVLALLAYSRVCSNQPRVICVSTGAALEQAIRQLAPTIQETGASIQALDLPNVSSDPHEMVQLFQNLLQNALEYRAPERPLIRVGAVPDGKFWHFSVADNGIGIEPQYFERIFVLFQRLHARGKHPGIGVGLAVCKKIVERHGGRIWVESERSRGTTFHFTLPADQSSATREG